VRIARRYRAALRAYPPGYRRSRGPELLATLADGDDDRGRPSMREAAALTYRGLTMRAQVAASPDGLLVASAALLLLAVLGWFDWAERVFLFEGKPAALASDGPGWWLTLALALGAYLVLAAGPFRAAEDLRRRRVAVLLAIPLALAAFTTPGRIFYAGVPDWDTLVEFAKWSPAAVFHNWTLTLPGSLGAVLVTWIALGALRGSSALARQRALGAALLLLAAVAVAQAWHRPDLPAEYARSAFADLGTATFLTAAGAALALIAMLRARPRAASRPLARP
jgi:hypothetical protein